MPKRPFEIWLMRNTSFEAQTDRMSASDAQAELMRVISAVWEEDTGPADSPLSSMCCDILEMLRPTGESFWRLEVKQRRRGKRKVPAVVAAEIVLAYRREIERGKSGFMHLDGTPVKYPPPRPKKVIIADLAQRHGFSDAAIREIIRRAGGKKPRR